MATTAKDIAALRRQMRETNNNVLKTALKKKISRLEEDMKSQKMTAKELASSLFKARTEIDGMNKSQFSSLIKRLAAKPEYSFLKGMTKGQVKDDLERPAKPVGWRFKGNLTRKPTAAEVKAGKRNGTVYYENRRRHSDVVRSVQLAKGGGVGISDLVIGNDYAIVDFGMGYWLTDWTFKGERKPNEYVFTSSKQFDNSEQVFTKDELLEYIKDGAIIENENVDDFEEFSKFEKGGGLKNSYEEALKNKFIPKDMPYSDWLKKYGEKEKFLQSYYNQKGMTESEQKKWSEKSISKFGKDITGYKMATGGGVGENYTFSGYKNFMDYKGKNLFSKHGLKPTRTYSEDEDIVELKINLSEDKAKMIGKELESLDKSGEGYGGYIVSNKMAKGGGVGDVNEENRDMVMNNNNQIMHHANELKEAVKKAKHIPAWVVAKVFEASSALSNVTHYLDGTTKMATGGSLKGNQNKLDMNKNGRLDAEDFKILRGKK